MQHVGTTWIEGAAGASAEGVLALRPELAEHVAAFDAHARASIGERLRSLLEIRGAQLLRDPAALEAADPALIEQATRWYDHPGLSEVERAALEVCETFLLDHHSMTDEQVVRLQQLLGEQGAVAVLMNIAMIDGFTKFRRVFTEGEF
jgi:hypothetical protein